MSSDPNQLPESDPQAQSGEPPADGVQPAESAEPGAIRKPRILIGSQRDPAAFSHRPKRDWTTGEGKRRRRRRDRGEGEGPSQADEGPAVPEAQGPVSDAAPTERPADAPIASPARASEPAAAAAPPEAPSPAPVAELPSAPVAPPAPAAPPAPPLSPQLATAEPAAQAVPAPEVEKPSEPPATPIAAEPPPPAAPPVAPPAAQEPSEPSVARQSAAPPPSPTAPAEREAPPRSRGDRAPRDRQRSRAKPEWTPAPKKLPVPNLRSQLTEDLAEEFEEAIGGVPLDELLVEDDEVTRQPAVELESRQKGRVVHVHRDDVFVELGGRDQGTVPLRQFPQPPEVGAEVEVVVNRFNAEDGLYDLSLPSMAADVADWLEISEGMTVEARVTGHNAGGLECEVSHIRGFIPVSQIALYRVEDMAEFAGQKLACLVTECNPQRRNLVLSRRAVLEREKEAARKELLQSLQPGQVRDGVVRKVMDFGAFVDLGNGVDGLLHVSKLSWARVEHPSEIVKEGQAVQVKVERVDQATGRISLSYREMQENPWTRAAEKFPQGAMVRGKVRKLMDFGAFVEVEPGVEGLVHVSELSHKRVWRPSDVVKEGDEVEVLVLSVDAEAQRMSLSIKQALPAPEKTASEKRESEPQEAAPLPKKLRQKSSGPLKGGLGGPSGGDQFGLKW